MTRYLLDTCVVLWWLSDPEGLRDEARSAIGNPRNLVCFSAVAMFEIAAKQAKGTLRIEGDFPSRVAVCRFEPLPLTVPHAQYVSLLPFHHKDPFDRLLIAQACVEGLTLITRDADVVKYDVSTLLA